MLWYPTAVIDRLGKVDNRYYYKVGHKSKHGGYTWGRENSFISSPAPGEDSVQRVIIFGESPLPFKKEPSLSILIFLPSSEPTRKSVGKDIHWYETG